MAAGINLHPAASTTSSGDNPETGRRDSVEDLGIFGHIAGIQTSEQEDSSRADKTLGFVWKLEDLQGWALTPKNQTAGILPLSALTVPKHKKPVPPTGTKKVLSSPKPKITLNRNAGEHPR